MPALVKLLLVFVGIILLLNRKWDLWLVLLLATAAIALLFGYPLGSTGLDAWAASRDPLTLMLSLVVVLVMLLGELMRSTAAMEELVEGFEALIPNRSIVMAALPAMIGLLPMIGGAMFSAPMVDEVGNKLGVEGERKTFINYWFRHVWEPIWPIYPSMVLAAGLMDLSIPQLIGAAWPVSAATIAGGILFGLWGMPRCSGADEADSVSRGEGLGKLAMSMWPIILAIVLSLVLPVGQYYDLALGLVISITLVVLVHRVPLRELWTILRERIPWKTVLVIFGALIFRRVLENSGAVIAVSEDLATLSIPVAAIALAVPFLAGTLTGIMAAAYTIGFPIVLPLLLAGDSTLGPEWANWLMVAGFMGGMFSPLHLCLALTRVYFEAEWGPVYRRIALATLLVVAVGVVYLLLA